VLLLARDTTVEPAGDLMQSYTATRESSQFVYKGSQSTSLNFVANQVFNSYLIVQQSLHKQGLSLSSNGRIAVLAYLNFSPFCEMRNHFTAIAVSAALTIPPSTLLPCEWTDLL
jgi:hypothetical protein